MEVVVVRPRGRGGVVDRGSGGKTKRGRGRVVDGGSGGKTKRGRGWVGWERVDREGEANSKHWFTTYFLQPLPYLVTP